MGRGIGLDLQTATSTHKDADGQKSDAPEPITSVSFLGCRWLFHLPALFDFALFRVWEVTSTCQAKSTVNCNIIEDTFSRHRVEAIEDASPGYV